MEITITSTIYIDIDRIIEDGNLDCNSADVEIKEAINDYCCGLDDCEYYLIGREQEDKIFERIREQIGEQMSFNIGV